MSMPCVRKVSTPSLQTWKTHSLQLDRRFTRRIARTSSSIRGAALVAAAAASGVTPDGLIFIMVPTIPPARSLDWLIKRVVGHNGYMAAEHIYAFTPRTAEYGPTSRLHRARDGIRRGAWWTLAEAHGADLQGDWHLGPDRGTSRPEFHVPEKARASVHTKLHGSP